jgi:DNA primase
MAHTDTIADPDIKSLYRRELSDRYSAFAFPPREERPWQGRGTSKRPGFASTGPSVNSGRLRRATSGGSRDSLCAAVIAGLLYRPDQIARHAESLARLSALDERFDALIDALEDSGESGTALESEQVATILARRGLAAPGPSDYAGFRFGFLSGGTQDAQTAAELANAIGLLIERPALERALAEATARLERDFSDEAYAEQQRLLKRKLEFDSRLRQMATARGAASAGEAHQTMAE